MINDRFWTGNIDDLGRTGDGDASAEDSLFMYMYAFDYDTAAADETAV